MTMFDTLIDTIHEGISKKDESVSQVNQKATRPLKMPKNYDFSVRNVNWN